MSSCPNSRSGRASVQRQRAVPSSANVMMSSVGFISFSFLLTGLSRPNPSPNNGMASVNGHPGASGLPRFRDPLVAVTADHRGLFTVDHSLLRVPEDCRRAFVFASAVRFEITQLSDGKDRF